MGTITTVEGIERNATFGDAKLSYCLAMDGNHEVLLSLNCRTPRRIALCNHEEDAFDIIKALEYAHKSGIV